MSRGRWRSVPYAPLSARQHDSINIQEAENRELKKLGHKALVQEQRRYVVGGHELDYKVWISCTCGKWMPDVFTALDAALDAHARHEMGLT